MSFRPVNTYPTAPPAPPPAPLRVEHEPRRRSLFPFAVAVTLVAGIAVGVPIGLATRASSPSGSTAVRPPSAASVAQARSLYSQAVRTTRGSQGFHYVSVSSGGTGTQTIAGDAGQDAGDQLITLDSTFGHEQFSLVLVSGTVYFNGNAPALEDQLGVPASGTAAVQAKWVSVSNGDGPYSVVEPGITAADQAGEMGLVPTSSLRVVTTGGVTATRIAGTVPPQMGLPAGKGHLDLRTGSRLPITYVSIVTDNGITITTTTGFSGWGHPPTASKPATAIPWSTLGASMPPGGYGGGGGLTPTPTPGT